MRLFGQHFLAPILKSPAAQRIQARGVAYVRACRFAGVTAHKVMAPKSEFQLQAEKQFLEARAKIPNGYIKGFTNDDVRNLTPVMRRCLHLRLAHSNEVSKFRKRIWIKKFQRSPTDTTSPAVRIACFTEKILNSRAAITRDPRNHPPKRALQIWYSERTKHMKYLYRTDFKLYEWVCNELNIKMIRFAIPGTTNPFQFINPLAVDGDRCKWMIRQRLYKGKHRPRPVTNPVTQQKVRYMRHPLETVPDDFGKPAATKQQITSTNFYFSQFSLSN